MTLAAGRRWKPFAVGGLCAIAIASLGGALTDLSPWYENLVKPSWQPPDWAFGPAWTIIFALCAYSFGLAWQAARRLKTRLTIAWFFAFNMFLNVTWSWLFFTLQRPDYALVEVVLLWLSVLALILALRPISRRASLALVPYLVWVGFAGAVNLAVVRLNAPFGVG